MLQLDGTRSNGHFGAESTALNDSRVGKLPIDARGAKVPPKVPEVPAPIETAPDRGPAPMVMLNRSGEHWEIRFFGIRNLSPNAMRLPFHRQESLRDVLAHVGKTWGGQLGGAWLLVAPGVE